MTTPPGPAMPEPTTLRLDKPVYGGDALGRTLDGQVVLVPFALPGELVQLALPPLSSSSAELPTVLEPSSDRTTPRCVHFGVCGGCQYQMAGYGTQLAMKEAILRETLTRAGLTDLPPLQVTPSPDPWGYRNRIRLRARTLEGSPWLGYSRRNTREFLPITMCPIAAPVLWETAEALMRVAAANASARTWFDAAAEVEIACDEAAARVQIHLLCAATTPDKAGFPRLAEQLQAEGVPLASLVASRLHVASGRATDLLASADGEGFPYTVASQRFWLGRGSFFQVNRLLLPTLVEIVTGQRHGQLAWDLYAGVGLFARTLAASFQAVTAVEASPAAVQELRRGLQRPQPPKPLSVSRSQRRQRPGQAPDDGSSKAVEATTLAFLRQAVLQRDRPDLVVLDPPRAGAGEEVCHLLLRLAPATMVYVSCDPTTLARDAAILLGGGYQVAALHLVDLFPQTYHLETVMVLHRRSV